MNTTIPSWIIMNCPAKTEGILTHLHSFQEIIYKQYDEKCALRLLKKANHIFIELYTNGVKHTQGAFFEMGIRCQSDVLEIQKLDDGPPPPFAMQIFSKQTIPYIATVYNTVTATYSSTNTLLFGISESKTMEEEFAFEHYGLQIITLAATQFSYTWLPQAKLNKFYCSVNV